MHLSAQWRWFCCCWFVFDLLLPLWVSVIVLCFVVRYVVSILVLQSSRSWLLCFVCLPGVSWLLSSWCLMIVVFLVSHDCCLPGVSWVLSSWCLMIVVFLVSHDCCLPGVSWLLSPWCLMIVVFLVSHDCCVALPRDAMGLSAICDCVISWSYTYCFWFLNENVSNGMTKPTQKVNEYDQEIPHSHTSDQPTATQSQDIRKTIKATSSLFLSHDYKSRKDTKKWNT